jgi:hypothetical protein
MARDMLCIPLAGVGVERVFNFARDMCGYRRGHLKPSTLRALLLVYHNQIAEARIDEHQRELHSTMDTTVMTDEEIEHEIETRKAEIDLRLNDIDSWDQDQYISDDEVPAAGRRDLGRTAWAKARLAYIERKARNAKGQPSDLTQELSSFQRNLAAQNREFLFRQQERHNNEDIRIYDLISSSPLHEHLGRQQSDNDESDGQRSDDKEPDGDYELPRLPQDGGSPSPTYGRLPKRSRARTILDRHLERVD